MDEIRVEGREDTSTGNKAVQTGELRHYQTPQLRRYSTPQLIQFGSIDSVVQASGGTGGDAGASSGS